jgi:hypothetical protein
MILLINKGIGTGKIEKGHNYLNICPKHTANHKVSPYFDTK